MKLDLHLHQKLEQRLQLSQQMLQNLELLQMPIMALKEKIDQELQENPTLEMTGDAEEAEAAPAPEAATAAAAEEERKREHLESFEEHWAESERKGYRAGSSEESDKRMEMLQNVGDGPASLRDHLREQLSVLEFDPGFRPYVEHLINNIDDGGQLQFPMEEIVESLPDELKKQDPETLKRKMEAALLIVQKLEPRGIGARTTKECLLLQLDEGDPQYAAKKRLIERHLEDIGHNRLPRIVREVAADPAALADFGYKPGAGPDILLDDVKMLIVEIQKLSPHPGARYASEVAPRVYPEVIIRQVEGRFEIVIEDSYLPPITVNRAYADMLKDKTLGKTEREFIRRKIDAGRKLISAIEQRRSTIQKITSEILKHQILFFEQGIEHLRPLKMQEVADTIGIHVSTVSRAISEKWIETPRGIFPLKFFFAGAAPRAEIQEGAPPPAAGDAAEPDEATRISLMERIREIVDDEDRKNPLSDLQIVKLLRQKGVTAARRTVAKYREELDIPSSRMRKQY